MTDMNKAARLLHEANRSWCIANGDDSQPPWEEIPDWQLDSIMSGIKFHLENPDAGDSASHDNWMAHKKADGWKYGPEKDPEKKTHPCMVPFEELPEHQQIKDAIFRNMVHTLFKKGTEHKGLPVKGYQNQPNKNIYFVNINKQIEELALRQLDYFDEQSIGDRRWLAIARTQLEQGFMAMNRGIFQPKRVELDEDFQIISETF